MQGLALLVTFGAIAKSDWPRAAMERARRKRISCSIRPFAALRANGGAGRIRFMPSPSPWPSPALRERGLICASREFTHWIPASRG